MKNILTNMAIITVAAMTFSACSTNEAQTPEAQKSAAQNFECKQEGVLAPKWTCIPEVEGYYAGVGVAQKSAAGIAHMRRVALMNGRSDLAQQIQTEVKDKMEGFTRATGVAASQGVDQVTTSVTKQVAKVDLKGSKAVNMWEAPSGAIYMLVTVPKKSINKEIKKAVTSTFKNDDALWQQFQSKEALKELDKEFPTE